MIGVEPNDANSEYWHNMVNINEYLEEKLNDYVNFTDLEYSPSEYIASHQMEASINGKRDMRLTVNCKLNESIYANTSYSLGGVLLPDDFEWKGSAVPVMIYNSDGEAVGNGCVTLGESGKLLFVSNVAFDTSYSIRGGNV